MDRHKKEAGDIEEARAKVVTLDEELAGLVQQMHAARVKAGAKLQLEGKEIFEAQAAAFFETLPDEEGATLLKQKKR